MARLTNEQRKLLLNFAKEQCEKLYPTQAIKKLEKQITEQVIKDLTNKFPLEEMNVLIKYGYACNINEVRLRWDKYGDDCYTLKLDKPLVVSNDFNYKKICVISDEKEKEIVQKLVEASDYRKNCIKNKMKNYEALIQSCNTLEQVIQIWSEAEVFKPTFSKNQTALCKLNEQVVSDIRKDVLIRQKIDPKEIDE